MCIYSSLIVNFERPLVCCDICRDYQSVGSGCIAPLDFFAKSLLVILLPVLFIFLLFVSYFFHWLWLRYQISIRQFLRFSWRFIKSCQMRESWRESRALAKRERDDQAEDPKVRIDGYIHTCAFLILFAYSAVTQTVLQYINCRSVSCAPLCVFAPRILMSRG